MKKISVLVVDDHPMVRRGLNALLSTCSEIEVVGEADNGSEALKLVETKSPQIVLMDLRLNNQDGLEISKNILHRYSDTKIIIITAFSDEETMLQAMQMGIYAFLQKSSADEEIINTIKLVNMGHHILTPSQVDPLIQKLKHLSKEQAKYELQLTSDDIKLLKMLANGYSSSQISEETFWSDRTVKRRVHQIIEKMQASNRTEAVVKAMQKGII